MSEQAYFPKRGQPVRLAFRWDDMESDFIFLKMTEEGITVTPRNEKKETAPKRKRIYFYPWRALDYMVWFADEQEAKSND